MVIPAGRTTPEPRTHEGYEWLYVLSGRLRLVLADHDLVMGQGGGRVRHAAAPLVRQHGEGPVELLSLFGRQGGADARTGAAAGAAGQRSGAVADQLLGGLGEVLGGVDGPPVGALRQREAGRGGVRARGGGRWCARGRRARGAGRGSPREDVHTRVDEVGRGRRLDEVGDVAEGVGPGRRPTGCAGRASARVAAASRSVWNAAISRSENRVQMSPLVAYQGASGRGRPTAAYFSAPPRRGARPPRRC